MSRVGIDALEPGQLRRCSRSTGPGGSGLLPSTAGAARCLSLDQGYTWSSAGGRMDYSTVLCGRQLFSSTASRSAPRHISTPRSGARARSRDFLGTELAPSRRVATRRSAHADAVDVSSLERVTQPTSSRRSGRGTPESPRKDRLCNMTRYAVFPAPLRST